MSADWIKHAKVGDKLACVVDADSSLRKGAIYTITGVFRLKSLSDVMGWTEIVILVKEARQKKGTSGFHPARFRPVHPRKADISIFTDMLKTVEQPLKEEA